VTVVVDASALLCVLFDEPGSEAVRPLLRGSIMSAVNYSETLSKIHDKGGNAAAVQTQIERLEITMVPFDAKFAILAANLRPTTRAMQFSFADRACLALAASRKMAVLTADKDWSKLDLGIEVRQFR
jgi:ribonuclease VapC